MSPYPAGAPMEANLLIVFGVLLMLLGAVLVLVALAATARLRDAAHRQQMKQALADLTQNEEKPQ